MLQAASATDRFQVIGGGFFSVLQDGADAHVMKWILHDWDDERSITVLKSCPYAMRHEGTLVVLEAVFAPSNEGARA